MRLPVTLSLTFLLALSACGFHPLYGEGMRPAELQLSTVSLENIEGRTGQKLRLMLADRFYGNHARSETMQYRLGVRYTTAKQELGIRRDDVATRARLNLTATFTLHDLTGAKPAFTGTERSFVSYNMLTDPYATSEAETDATERGLAQLADAITSRIALHLAGQNHENQ